MEIPRMILFDYGQTLIAEQKFDGVKGTEAVLQYAARNKYHLSAEQVQAKANEINRGFGRFWYIGAMDLPYTEDKNILTVTEWKELRQRMEGH